MGVACTGVYLGHPLSSRFLPEIATLVASRMALRQLLRRKPVASASAWPLELGARSERGSAGGGRGSAGPHRGVTGMRMTPASSTMSNARCGISSKAQESCCDGE